jgi:hypothetical protein
MAYLFRKSIPKLRRETWPFLGAPAYRRWIRITQVEALKAASADRIFAEKISGVRADRPQLAKLMKALRPGDIVVVTKINRLGRSTRELLDLIHQPRRGRRFVQELG